MGALHHELWIVGLFNTIFSGANTRPGADLLLQLGPVRIAADALAAGLGLFARVIAIADRLDLSPPLVRLSPRLSRVRLSGRRVDGGETRRGLPSPACCLRQGPKPRIPRNRASSIAQGPSAVAPPRDR